MMTVALGVDAARSALVRVRGLGRRTNETGR